MRTLSQREINDTTLDGMPANFSTVGVRLSGINRISMAITHRVWPWPQDSIYLFGRDAEANRYSAQVFIDVFPLPEGVRKFENELSLYLKQRKGFLVEGAKFDPSQLLPKSFASGFQVESFQTRDGIHRWRVVHVFRAPARAVILVYSLGSARFTSSDFFRQVSESLKIG